MGYTIIEPRMRAVIDNEEYSINSWSASFMLNQIPVATVTLPVGVSIESNQLAKIHTKVDNLATQVPAKVYLTAKVRDTQGAIPGVPDGQELLVFDGDVSGTGWNRQSDNAQFTVPILHWLNRLDYSSAISAASHPGNPADLSYPAIFEGTQLNTTDASNPAWIPGITATELAQTDLSDLWGNVFHKWLTRMAEREPFDFSLISDFAESSGPSTAILTALKRMGPNPEGVPLQLAEIGEEAGAIRDAILDALQNESATSWVNTTLWGKLIGDWAAMYEFAVVPRVEDALIVPFTGGLREHWATIGLDDYRPANFNGQSNRVLRALGVVHPVGWQTGAPPGSGNGDASMSGLAGLFVASDITDGVVLIKDAPAWLSAALPGANGTPSTGSDGETVSTANDGRDAGVANAAVQLPNIMNAARPLLDKYAQQYYAMEALKGRIGELSGKLRFDIAPGSNVAIHTASAKNIRPGADRLARVLYATVVGVTYHVSADPPAAGTAFTLAHIRTTKENKLDATSVKGPPLYQKAWLGASLLANLTPEK